MTRLERAARAYREACRRVDQLRAKGYLSEEAFDRFMVSVRERSEAHTELLAAAMAYEGPPAAKRAGGHPRGSKRQVGR